MGHPTLQTRIRKHLWYYVSFIALQITGLILVVLVSGNRDLQLQFIFLTTGLYIFWALLHQYIHHTLSAKIAAEYIMFGMFGIAITYLIL